MDKSLHYTLCHLDKNDFYKGTFGFSIGLYVLSKGPEFTDTFFMLLSGKEVPFIQWFHHVTTFLYCWHAYSVGSSALNFAASLNYSVHVIMYLYFTLAEAGLKSVVKRFSMLITTTQLIQFIYGSFLTFKLIYHKFADRNLPDNCSGTPWDAANIQLFIVLANLYMFTKFFYNAYIKKKPAKTASGTKEKKN
ncbi:beta-ketoacyl-CoA synthase [Angomonas deanei]|uniref:Elongation of fatty acids protein n=1 Tax=Angomonas deanei TaxID=59799 RepID=A0A7G2C6L3_9TRYP|nr:beta-ketoacyl-CoA synthase [Angomonas deanei]CAD2215105.1 GNS1/SUR4 family, putative [Angomonas deanei]|eukprot:EPY39517.1 beta-ketoacyl-CoA synthase [Angomonas deanei]